MSHTITKQDVHYNIKFAMKELNEAIHYKIHSEETTLINLIKIRQEISSTTKFIENLE